MKRSSYKKMTIGGDALYTVAKELMRIQPKSKTTPGNVPMFTSKEAVSNFKGKGKKTTGAISYKEDLPTVAATRIGMKAPTASFKPPGEVVMKSSNVNGQEVSGSDGGDKSVLKDLIPYASNIINSFRRPPMPSRRARVSLVTAPRISLDNRRRELEGQIRGLDRNADLMLDENTSAAVKRSNLAAKLREGSGIAEAEANANAEMAQRAAGMNTSINMYNAGKTDEFNDLLTNRSLAMTRFSQQNLADVSDKYMKQQEQADAATLDLKKGAYLAKLFEKSGVLERLDPEMAKHFAEYAKGGVSVKKFGGRMKMYPDGGDLPNRKKKLDEWNNFVGFLDQKKIDAQALNKRDQNMGKGLLNEWLKTNPNSSLRYEDVPYIQEQFKNYRNYVIGQHKIGKLKIDGDPGPNYEKFMPELSQVDGWLGSQTYRRFPKEYLVTLENGQEVAKTDKGVASVQKRYGGTLKRRKIS